MWIAYDVEWPDGRLRKSAESTVNQPTTAVKIDPVLAGCLAGDPKAQRALFDFLLPYLRHAVQRYVWEEEEVQDVLQEAFVRIYRSLDQFDASKAQVQTWATRIAINQAITSGKRKAARPQVLRDEDRFNERGEGPAVLEDLAAEDLLHELRRMPPELYQVLMLHAVDGHDHGEVAELLGISVWSSRKRLSRARKWVKKHFGRHEKD
jgi:RNA polymerase sigma-70 factor (ECF subfamily)